MLTKHNNINLTPSRKIQDSEIVPYNKAITPMSLQCANIYSKPVYLADVIHNGLENGFSQWHSDQLQAIKANTYKFKAMQPIHTINNGFSLKTINYANVVKLIASVNVLMVLVGLFA